MPFNITCKASLNPKLAEQLIGFVKLEWVYNTSQVSGDGVTVEQQYTSQSSTSLSLIFNPLNMSHGGNYVCKAELMLPDSPQSFHTTELYHLNVLSKLIIIPNVIIIIDILKYSCMAYFCLTLSFSLYHIILQIELFFS